VAFLLDVVEVPPPHFAGIKICGVQTVVSCVNMRASLAMLVRNMRQWFLGTNSILGGNNRFSGITKLFSRNRNVVPEKPKEHSQSLKMLWQKSFFC
jgi:hypothetical protein